MGRKSNSEKLKRVHDIIKSYPKGISAGDLKKKLAQIGLGYLHGVDDILASLESDRKYVSEDRGDDGYTYIYPWTIEDSEKGDNAK